MEKDKRVPFALLFVFNSSGPAATPASGAVVKDPTRQDALIPLDRQATCRWRLIQEESFQANQGRNKRKGGTINRAEEAGRWGLHRRLDDAQPRLPLDEARAAPAVGEATSPSPRTPAAERCLTRGTHNPGQIGEGAERPSIWPFPLPSSTRCQVTPSPLRPF